MRAHLRSALTYLHAVFSYVLWQAPSNSRLSFVLLHLTDKQKVKLVKKKVNLNQLKHHHDNRYIPTQLEFL